MIIVIHILQPLIFIESIPAAEIFDFFVVAECGL